MELDEFEEDIEDDEFVLCTVFRCGMNIRETSSALIEFRPLCPPPLLFQPSLDNGWRLGGEATAVVIGQIRWDELRNYKIFVAAGELLSSLDP